MQNKNHIADSGRIIHPYQRAAGDRSLTTAKHGQAEGRALFDVQTVHKRADAGKNQRQICGKKNKVTPAQSPKRTEMHSQVQRAIYPRQKMRKK